MICLMIGVDREIIVVDDDTGVSRAIERMLHVSGWSARSFISAEDFLGSDAVEDVTLLILDVHLPGMSGLELHEHLAGIGVHRPAIFITGQDRPFYRERALQAGAIAYLTKPFPGQELIDAVRRHLDGN